MREKASAMAVVWAAERPSSRGRVCRPPGPSGTNVEPPALVPKSVRPRAGLTRIALIQRGTAWAILSPFITVLFSMVEVVLLRQFDFARELSSEKGGPVTDSATFQAPGYTDRNLLRICEVPSRSRVPACLDL